MNTKKVALFIVSFLWLTLASAQSIADDIDASMKEMEKVFDDAIFEDETDQLTLRFNHAISGNPIKDAIIKINGKQTGKTDYEGKIRFDRLKDGKHSVQVLKDGINSDILSFQVAAGTIFQNSISVSPVLKPKTMRIILDWNSTPKDLDAHLIKKDDFHISYRNMKSVGGGIGQLDRDDMDGNGPETITLYGIKNNGEYHYFVHNYSHRDKTNSSTLGSGGAVARVYFDGRYYKMFAAPASVGNYWHIFSVVNGSIVEINKISNQAP